LVQVGSRQAPSLSVPLGPVSIVAKLNSVSWISYDLERIEAITSHCS